MGLHGFVEFKHYFGSFAKQTAVKHLGNGRVKRWEYEMPVGFKNINILTEKIKEIGQRVVKDDVLDLPLKSIKKSILS